MLLSHSQFARQAQHVTLLFLCTICCGATADEQAGNQPAKPIVDQQFQVRHFSPFLDGQWIGQAICYGPYRAGQSPGGKLPNREQLAEDLRLLTQHWNLLRMYGSRDITEDVLAIIQERELPLRVIVGAWITRESESETVGPAESAAAIASNRAEVAAAIRLADAYPKEVIAVSVGNETQVFWSDHKTQPEVLIRYIREVRAATRVPVTTADDFNFWNKPESQALADEVDFIVTHIHAMWAGLELSEAMSWTKGVYKEISDCHPSKTVVIGEAGWATQVHNEGEQARLIKGQAGEEEQRWYYQQLTDWTREHKICCFFFEAFDEAWKGGPHPDEVEKHWGLFGENREPKAAMNGAAEKR